MRLFTLSVWVAVVLLLTVPAGATDLGTASPLDGKVVKELYPAPYDTMLDRLFLPEERMVAVFRSLCVARANPANVSAGTFLIKALEQYYRVQCALVKHDLLAASKPADAGSRVRTVFAELPLAGDRAAFTALFAIFRADKLAALGITDIVTQAQTAAEGLSNATGLAAYAAKIPAEFRPMNLESKVGFWNRQRDNLDRLLDRVRAVFSAENVLRFLARAQTKTGPGPLGDRITTLRQRLAARLIGEIRGEFQALVDDGLCGSEITLIGVQDNNMLTIKESLLKGRLRIFIKRAQLAETQIDRELFSGLLIAIAQEIRKVTAGAAPTAGNYGKMVVDTLDLIRTIKLRQATATIDPPELAKLLRQIGDRFKADDDEHFVDGINTLF